jgi:exosortase K
MNQKVSRKSWAQLVVVLLCALMVKLFYSTASPNELRWILAPTTATVELITRIPFAFESHAGYISSDRTFLIAGSCAGVNFLMTAFLMLSLRKLWLRRHLGISWGLIPAIAGIAYLATLVANTVRISVALWLQRTDVEIGGLSSNQLHRLEGILVYFGFLLLLFAVNEGSFTGDSRALLRKFLFPLLIYYATMLGIPLANAGFGWGIVSSGFSEHLAFVLVAPLICLIVLWGLSWVVVALAPAEPDIYRNPGTSLNKTLRSL